MDPLTKTRLDKFPPALFYDFIVCVGRVKRRSQQRAKVKAVELAPSSVNRRRLAILKQFQNPRSQKDIDRAYKIFLNCPQLVDHASLILGKHSKAGPNPRPSWIDIMSIPFAPRDNPEIADAKSAVIQICMRNEIPIKTGDKDFIEICLLMLRALGSDHQSKHQSKRAFRRGVISLYETLQVNGTLNIDFGMPRTIHPRHPPQLELIHLPIDLANQYPARSERTGTNLTELAEFIGQWEKNGQR